MIFCDDVELAKIVYNQCCQKKAMNSHVEEVTPEMLDIVRDVILEDFTNMNEGDYFELVWSAPGFIIMYDG
jgi:hypothetical protein